MDTIQIEIMSRVRRRFGGGGAVVVAKDFLDLGTRAAVDQGLSRLVRRAKLQRIGRGLYHLPRTNATLGIQVPPDADVIAAAIGRQAGYPLAPSPAIVANRLGLSTQIPARPTYITTGPSRSVRVGNQTFTLKHVTAGKFPASDSEADQALQAILGIGRDVDEGVLARLRGTLSPAARRQLLDKARNAPDWVTAAVRRLASSDELAVANG